jgi:hypothetical protein
MMKKNNEYDFVKRIKVIINNKVIMDTDKPLEGEAYGEEE